MRGFECVDKAVIREEKFSRFLAVILKLSKSAHMNERFKILQEVCAFSVLWNPFHCQAL